MALQSAWLPTVVWPSDVEAEKRRIDPLYRTTDAAVQSCPALTAQEKEAWARDNAAWSKFRAEDVPIFGSANKWDEAHVYEARLAGWQDTIRMRCNVPGPPVAPHGSTLPADTSTLKYVAIAVIAVAAAYVLSPLVLGARKVAA